MKDRVFLEFISTERRRFPAENRVKNTAIFFPSLTFLVVPALFYEKLRLPINSPCRELNKIYLAGHRASTEFHRIPVNAEGASGFDVTSMARGERTGGRRRDAVTDVKREHWRSYFSRRLDYFLYIV